MSRKPRIEKSDLESQAEGGMRATEPGYLGDDRVEELIEEARLEEGHMVEGSRAREEAMDDAGAELDLEPPGLSGRRLDERRRAAKRSFRPTGSES